MNSLKIVPEFYSVEAVSGTKVVLFNSVKVEGHRNRKYREHNKKKKDLADMFRLILAAELTVTPIFLAMDTTLLLPLPNDCQDMSAMLNQMECIQATVELLSINLQTWYIADCPMAVKVRMEIQKKQAIIMNLATTQK